MRIDDHLNVAAGAPAASKPERQAATAERGPVATASDEAVVSSAAEQAQPSEARLEVLRASVERGEYRVDSREVAKNIIDAHLDRGE